MEGTPPLARRYVMRRSEYKARAAQRESAYNRWADDGGHTPDPEVTDAIGFTRSPWLAVGVAAALGFAIGWMTNPPRSRGGR
jgi:ElaB/YqjD/DUF883 family membrane-anchored ribosome-binding protein